MPGKVDKSMVGSGSDLDTAAAGIDALNTDPGRESYSTTGIRWQHIRRSLAGLFDGRRKGSIVDRIFWLLVLWGMFTYMLAIAGLWWGSSHIIEDSFENQAAEWVRKLDELGTPLYASGDARLFESVQEHVERFPELSYLRYYQADGEFVIGEYYSSGFAMSIPYLSKTEFADLAKAKDSDQTIFVNTFDDDYSPSLMTVSWNSTSMKPPPRQSDTR